MQGDNFSRSVLAATTAILALWGIWALVGVAAGFGKLSYAAFGLISPEVGLVCGILSGIGLWRAARLGKPTRYAVAGLLVSVVVAIVPLVTLLTVCDGCLS
jgi:hypothetical protein